MKYFPPLKTFLLGSAALIVPATSSAFAADLPVKSRPIEYVKVCSLYGAGFYYIPGTDICMKVGGYVRAEYAYGHIGASLTSLQQASLDGQRTRTSGPDYNQRARILFTQDTRQQTEYGTLRTYMNIGFTFDVTNAVPAPDVFATRAMIQLAGFTFGLATSYYDFFLSPAVSYSIPWASNVSDPGWKVLAYTAQFGNVSATLSFERPRRTSVTNVNIGTPAFGVGALPTVDQIKMRYPDIVANIRIDQAWGSFQVMGALHDASGGHYGTTLVGSVANGHPRDVMGWAAGAGIRLNASFVSPGDFFQGQINVTRGATPYAAYTPSALGSPGIFSGGDRLGVGWFTDGVFCTTASANCPGGNSQIELTSALSFQAAYEHFWTPSLKTSLVYAHAQIRYSDAASRMMCDGLVAGAGNGLSALTNCGPGSFNFGYWSLSSRTQWNLTQDFYIGLEGYYGRLQTMSKGQTATYTTGGDGLAQPTGTRTLGDQSVVVSRVRVHRDIVP